jgi:hypothetical protein
MQVSSASLLAGLVQRPGLASSSNRAGLATPNKASHLLQAQQEYNWPGPLHAVLYDIAVASQDWDKRKRAVLGITGQEEVRNGYRGFILR